eukprot:223731_1
MSVNKKPFRLECPAKLKEWRQDLQKKSPRIGNKLRALQRIENKLLKKLYNQTYTSCEDPMATEKQQKKANTAPTKTLTEINTFVSEQNYSETAIEEEDEGNTIHNKIDKDWRYEVTYYQDEELGFDISCANEAVC